MFLPILSFRVVPGLFGAEGGGGLCGGAGRAGGAPGRGGGGRLGSNPWGESFCCCVAGTVSICGSGCAGVLDGARLGLMGKEGTGPSDIVGDWQGLVRGEELGDVPRPELEDGWRC